MALASERAPARVAARASLGTLRAAEDGLAGALRHAAEPPAVARAVGAAGGLAPLTNTHSDLSFPSAHATTSLVAARAYASLLPAAPLRALALAMAAARVALGVHHPSDVLTGAALGWTLGGTTR